MQTSKSQAVWCGSLKKGSGSMTVGTNKFTGQYSFGSRFEDSEGTTPEELIAAAHAGCYSMALAGMIGENGYEPKHVGTTAAVHLAAEGGGFSITKIDLMTEAQVEGMNKDAFQKLALDAKENCPVSKALAGVEISLDATLL
ncbi:MAG: OsmC family protein [bacterium]